LKSKAQIALRGAFAGDANSKGYVCLPQENLLPGVRLEQFESDLRRGDGNELRMKFCAVHSSSALAVNCFAPFKDSPATMPILGKSGGKRVEFEKQLEILPERKPANLDVWVEWEDGVLAVESKLLEYFDQKKPEFAQAYEQCAPPWSEPCWWSIYDLAKQGTKAHLDRAQLIKHYFALRKRQQNPQNKFNYTLLYIFWEPTNWQEVEVCKKHRKEVEEFADRVSDSTVSFRWMTYAQLWRDWSAIPALAQHVSNLKARYEVRL
jgi:Restriction Endonuclease associating with ARP